MFRLAQQVRRAAAVGGLPVDRGGCAARRTVDDACSVRRPDRRLLVSALEGEPWRRATGQVQDVHVVVRLEGSKGEAPAIRREPHLADRRLHVEVLLLAAVTRDHHDAGLAFQHAAGSVCEGAGLRDIVLGAAVRRTHLHAFHDRQRGPEQLALDGIERGCEQRSAVAVHDVAGRQIPGVRAAGDERLRTVSSAWGEEDPALVERRDGIRTHREQDGVRQHLRPQVAAFVARRIGFQDDLGVAPVRGDAREPEREPRNERDGAVGAPPGAGGERTRVADHRGRPAVDRDLLQLAVGREPDPPAIRGEERIQAALGTGQRRDLRAGPAGAGTGGSSRRAGWRRRSAIRPARWRADAPGFRARAVRSPEDRSTAAAPPPARSRSCARTTAPRLRLPRSTPPRPRAAARNAEAPAAGRPARPPDARGSRWIAIRASPMSRRRILTFRSRQRRSSSRTARGVSFGSRPRSMSPFSTSASVCEIGLAVEAAAGP